MTWGLNKSALDRYITGNYGENSVPRTVVITPAAWEWVCPYCKEIQKTQLHKGMVTCPECEDSFDVELNDCYLG